MKNWEQFRDEIRNKECPEISRDMLLIRDSLDVLSGKWTIQVYFAILKGHRRFSEIAKFCGKLSDKVLNQNLSILVENKIIEKQENEYELTEHGVNLYDTLKQLWLWGLEHRKIMFS